MRISCRRRGRVRHGSCDKVERQHGTIERNVKPWVS